MREIDQARNFPFSDDHVLKTEVAVAQTRMETRSHVNMAFEEADPLLNAWPGQLHIFHSIAQSFEVQLIEIRLTPSPEWPISITVEPPKSTHFDLMKIPK